MDGFRAGLGTADCTPTEPRQLSGYGPGSLTRVSTGIHSPLSAKALVLDDGTTTLGVVTLDLLNVYEAFSDRVRARVADLELDHLLLTATHTHAAPYMPGRFLEVNPLLSYDVPTEAYVDRVESAVEEAVRTAHDALAPATLGIGHAENDEVPHNRRRENGPVDPDLTALTVSTDTGTDAVLMNYTCHPVCTNARETLVSADWPATLYERVREETGREVLFVNGATGDINPRESRSRRPGEELYDYMERVGASVAEAAIEACDDAGKQVVEVPTLSTTTRPVDLSLQPLDGPASIQAEYDALTEEIAAHGGEAEGADFQRLQSEDDPRGGLLLERWYTEEKLRLAEWGVDSFETALTYLKVGPVGLLTVPGEAFVEHGLDFKAAAAADHLVVAGFADDYVGYFPTVDAWPEGGYEVRTCKFAREAMGTFREAAFDLVAE